MADIDGGEVLFTIRGDASQLEAELGRARDGLEDLEGAADDAAGGLDGMGAQAGRVNGAMKGLSRGGISGLGAAVRLVNPQLGSMIVNLGTLHRNAPQLAKALKALPAALGPVGIAIGVVTAAFGAMTYATKKLGKELDEMEERVEKSGDASSRAARLQRELRDTVDGLNEEYGLLTGQLQETDLQVEAFNKDIDEMVAGLIDQHKEMGTLTEGIRANFERLGQNAKDRNEQIQREREAIDDLAEGYRQLEEAQEAAADADIPGPDREADRLMEIDSQIEGIISGSKELASEMAASMEQFNSDVEQGLDEAGKQIEDQMEANKKGVEDTISGVSSLAATLSENMAEENSKAAKSIFRVSQAAALTEVAMNTGVAIMKALAVAGPFMGPAVATGIAATAAAQTAIILSQKPPAHMGDPMAPDETTTASGRRVLSSEAVLDSATTRRMGGEDGLRAAMRGDGGQPVNVTLSYKHLDREIARLMRSDSRTRRAIKGR